MKEMRIAILFVVGSISIPAWAQDNVSTLLKGLGEQTKAYQRSIPNFSCSEIVTTTAKQGEKVEKRIEFQADVRVHRKDDKSLEETFSITNYMGKPTPQGGKFDLPLYMSGGLSEGMPSFFEESAQACYGYRRTPGRVDFQALEGQTKCKEVPGTAGFALLDAQDKLLHGEIERPREGASRKHVAALAKADYGDVRLDDRTFRMPIHVYGESQRGRTVLTFDAYYTACKLYTAKATIRAGDGADAPPTSP